MSVARNAAQAALITVFVGGFAGPLYALATLVAGSDPWLGAHAAYVCGEICEGCRGPYASRGGTKVNGSSRGGKAAKLYCQPPKGSLDEVEDRERYVVEDGSVRVIGAGYGVMLPLVFGSAFGVVRVWARRKGQNSV